MNQIKNIVVWKDDKWVNLTKFSLIADFMEAVIHNAYISKRFLYFVFSNIAMDNLYLIAEMVNPFL
jgi:hypothetical protein